MRRLRIPRNTVLARTGIMLHAQTPDCPKWNYAPVNTNAASGMEVSFDPATAVIVKISITAKMKEIAVKLTKDIKTARGFFAMDTGSLDTAGDRPDRDLDGKLFGDLRSSSGRQIIWFGSGAGLT